MYFDTLQQAMSMAGHGAYVWSAYGISLFVIVALVVWPLRRYRQELSLLASSGQRGASARIDAQQP